MNDFGTYFFIGIAFLCIIEGICWALFPQKMLQYVQNLAQLPLQSIRLYALILLLCGVALLYAVKP